MNEKEIINEVLTSTGVEIDRIYINRSPLKQINARARIQDGERIIDLFGPLLETVGENGLKGIIAHELGHLQLHHSAQREGIYFALSDDIEKSRICWRQEYDADKWAVLHGYGEALLESFEKASLKYGPSFLTRFSSEHPPMEYRIRRIQSLLSTKYQEVA